MKTLTGLLLSLVCCQSAFAGNFEACRDAVASTYYETDKIKLRLSCIDRLKNELTIEQCGELASNYYETDSVKAKSLCIASVNGPVKACGVLAHSNYYETDRIEAKKACLVKNKLTMAIADCLSVAETNYYETDKTSQRNFCLTGTF